MIVVLLRFDPGTSEIHVEDAATTPVCFFLVLAWHNEISDEFSVSPYQLNKRNYYILH